MSLPFGPGGRGGVELYNNDIKLAIARMRTSIVRFAKVSMSIDVSVINFWSRGLQLLYITEMANRHILRKNHKTWEAVCFKN